MSSIINASNAGAGGIIQTADASGTLNLQGGGVTGLSISNTGVPTLTTAGIFNTPASISLTNATNFLSVNDVTTFLTGASVLIGNGTTAIVNTGSIGAAGQKWEITGVALIGATSGATLAGVAIWNGSAWVATGGGVATFDNWPVTSICRCVVTLSGATTFTLYGTGNNGNCYAYLNGYGAGSVGGACFISARRLT
jgi:hypothetical protein